MGERKTTRRRAKSPPRKRANRRGTDRQILAAAFGPPPTIRNGVRDGGAEALLAVVEHGTGRAVERTGRISRAGARHAARSAGGGLATPAGRSRLARTLAAVGSRHRLELLSALGAGVVDAEALQKAARLRGGPLYHHINQLRLAGLVTSRGRDSYELTRIGRRLLLILTAADPLIRGGH